MYAERDVTKSPSKQCQSFNNLKYSDFGSLNWLLCPSVSLRRFLSQFTASLMNPYFKPSRRYFKEYSDICSCGLAKNQSSVSKCKYDTKSAQKIKKCIFKVAVTHP